MSTSTLPRAATTSVRVLLSAALISLAFACSPDGGGQAQADTQSQTDSLSADAGTSDTGPVVSFQKDVMPIFQAHCVGCHGVKKPQGDLDLTDPKATGLFKDKSVFCNLKTGAALLPSVIPHAPDESPLVRKLEDTKLELVCGREMPANGTPLVKTHPEAVATIRAWIAAGAVVD